MSCKHEFETLRTADGSFCMTACRKCMKSTGEIETLAKAESLLAAANARAEQADAQNKRMQTAINRYVIGNIELLDALKAALEEKP